VPAHHFIFMDVLDHLKRITAHDALEDELLKIAVKPSPPPGMHPAVASMAQGEVPWTPHRL